MKPFSGVLILILGLSVLSCSKHEVSESTSGRVLRVEDFPPDIRIPTKAYSVLDYSAAEHGDDSSGHGSAVGGAAKALVFSKVSVTIKEKNPGVVKDGSVTIHFERGGGQIDLADFITEAKGSFYVEFDFPEFENGTQKKVLFVSKTRKRRLGEQVFGAGCNQYFDITDSFLKAMSSTGIKVNTVRERYTSVLGGNFLFSSLQDHTVYLAQVSFIDSKHTHLFCKEP